MQVSSPSPRYLFTFAPRSWRSHFHPWWSAQQVFATIASADAAVVRTTAIPTLMVVRPDDHGGLARLRDAGVWLTLDPRAIAACFIKEKDI